MKIIEELHKMSMLNNGDDWKDDLDKEVLTDYFSKESASIASSKITKDIAVKFADYCHSNSWDKYDLGMYSTKELFNKFLETLEKEKVL